MKKLFATCLLLLNILPTFAAPRYEEDYEGGFLGGILIYGSLLIIFIICVLRTPPKK